MISTDKKDHRGIRKCGNGEKERRPEAERRKGMTEDEGEETRERKQTATVVEKGQGVGAREKIKNRGVETKPCSFMRAL